jgi:hypothetical protein
MAISIQFNNQSFLWATEVGNVFSNRMLPAKFEIGEALVPEEVPEFFFFGSLVLAKLPGFLDDI